MLMSSSVMIAVVVVVSVCGVLSGGEDVLSIVSSTASTASSSSRYGTFFCLSEASSSTVIKPFATANFNFSISIYRNFSSFSAMVEESILTLLVFTKLDRIRSWDRIKQPIRSMNSRWVKLRVDEGDVVVVDVVDEGDVGGLLVVLLIVV